MCRNWEFVFFALYLNVYPIYKISHLQIIFDVKPTRYIRLDVIFDAKPPTRCNFCILLSLIFLEVSLSL